ncbi:MAG: heavy-metal-associated domain-containing protein [Flavobacteriaceae bacterium]|nr:heavy-metal-associated domain-containing protein [Flavobacteriaceae bacterium]
MRTTLYIQNLKCDGCAQSIRKALEKKEGISDVSIHIEEASVTFNYLSKDRIDEAKEILSKLGYPIQGVKNPLTKKAKSFVSCAVGRMGK